MRVFGFTAMFVFVALGASTWADTNIVTEDFTYADQAAFETTWRPDAGTGYTPAAGPNGILVPNLLAGLTPPNDDPPGIQGQGVNISVGINEYDDDNNSATEPFQLVPTATESVQFSGDIFSDTLGNKRVSIGLRNDTVQRAFGVFGYNYVELGQYQAATYDPTLPAPPVFNQPATSFAYRVVLFDSATIGLPLQQTPDWQYFPLDPTLDTKDSAGQPLPDGLVTPVDIGEGWHRYTATITPTEITLELDLYRDGLKNSAALEGVGTPGVDSSVTWTIAPTNVDLGDGFDFDPFTSLRIGSPSGVGTLNEAVVDNVSLDLVTVPIATGADFDGDQLVDGRDFLIWQKGFGLIGQTDNSNGDANSDTVVDGLDQVAWGQQFGGAPPLSAGVAAGAIPEPTTATLSLLATLGLAFLARGRRQDA